jgi:hypothetical protein
MLFLEVLVSLNILRTLEVEETTTPHYNYNFDVIHTTWRSGNLSAPITGTALHGDGVFSNILQSQRLVPDGTARRRIFASSARDDWTSLDADI